MIPSEIRRELDLRQRSNIARTLKGFLMRGIVVCLNPQANKGHLYQLTSKGIELRKLFQLTPKGIELRKRFLSNEQQFFPDVKMPSGIDINLYSEIVSGKARRAVTRGLKGVLIASAIRKRAKQHDSELGEFNNTMTLRSLIKKGLVISKYDKKLRNFAYELTPKGLLIQEFLAY